MNPEILILLSIYKEAPFLKELLDSLKQQSFRNFQVLCRFDGKCENLKNKNLLMQYSFVQILGNEDHRGVSDSYGELLRNASHTVPYIMFADQDDVWDPDKIETTLKLIKEKEKECPGEPVLAHSDLRVVSDDLTLIAPSFQKFQSLNCKKNSFRQILIQNNVTGCTILINRALARITAFPDGVICHDWYLALIASAFGSIAYCSRPLISYRQHSENCYGAVPRKRLLAGILAREMLREKVRSTRIQAKTFLDQYEQKLSDQQKQLLKDWSGSLQEKSYWKRLAIAWKHRLVKNDWIRTLGMWWAV